MHDYSCLSFRIVLFFLIISNSPIKDNGAAGKCKKERFNYFYRSQLIIIIAIVYLIFYEISDMYDATNMDVIVNYCTCLVI